MNLFVIFLTGLSIGGLTCAAVQGGLLAALIAEREKENLKEGINKKEILLPTAAFLIAKLISHVLLGFALGFLGETFAISERFQSFIQILAGIYILIIALNLLNVHPIFRYAIIQPPKFITKRIRSTSKSKAIFAPAIMGFMTIFIPCGTTLAMEALAISSSNPFTGAAIMGVFVLGTMPLFFGLGYLTTVLGNAFKDKFLKFSAVLLIVLSITSIKGGISAMGFSFPDLSYLMPIEDTYVPETLPVVNGLQMADISVYPNYYSPSYVRVKVNEPVRLNLISMGGTGCTAFFRIPSLNIKADLAYTRSAIVEFTPTKKGRIKWMCSMGMYEGFIEVI